MSPKRKDSGFADTADMAMSESEETGPIMASPPGPAPKRTRLDTSAGRETGGEEVSSHSAVLSPPNDLHAQGFSAEGMDAGPSQPPDHPSYTSVEPGLFQPGKGKEKEEEPPEDSGHFPICICIRQAVSFFMLASSNWSMERFQQEILTALNSHGNAESYSLLINCGFGQLTVVWESERRKAFLNSEFPSFTAIDDHNIHATLEFLKRKRSDVVVVDFAAISAGFFERYVQSYAGPTND
ncbi:MAG: hypothetical protein LQ346_008789 [Caloplaca aetnensis]|nr:MAG: hypothetical protein LQ346_008789 [Caloplaca aetnensis]